MPVEQIASLRLTTSNRPTLMHTLNLLNQFGRHFLKWTVVPLSRAVGSRPSRVSITAGRPEGFSPFSHHLCHKHGCKKTNLTRDCIYRAPDIQDAHEPNFISGSYGFLLFNCWRRLLAGFPESIRLLSESNVFLKIVQQCLLSFSCS